MCKRVVVTRTHHTFGYLFSTPFYLFLVPLEAPFEWALVFVDKAQGMAKLVKDCRLVHKTQIHGKGLLGDSKSIGSNI